VRLIELPGKKNREYLKENIPQYFEQMEELLLLSATEHMAAMSGRQKHTYLSY
jgi:predicted DNA-binding protein